MDKRILATLTALTLLAACGGEEGDGSSSKSNDSSGASGSGILVCFTYLLVSGNSDCIGWGSGSSTSTGGFTTGVRYVINPDVEPNNDMMNAHHLVFEGTSAPDGFIVDGEIDGTYDLADTFSLSRRTVRNFRFKLCAPGQHDCTEWGEIDTLTAYIDILDSSGRVVVSSQAASRNFISARINAGVTYYVRIAAGDTMGSNIGYYLMAQEYE